jgi:hypothetical protein
MKRWIVRFGSMLLIAAISGCASIETGLNWKDANASAVDFNLHRQDAVSGAINPIVPDDEPSVGQFF